MKQANDNLPPVCDRCENIMERYGKIAKFGTHPAFQVFRCADCKIVSSQVIPG